MLIPSWLEFVDSQAHIDHVLTTLARREQARENARRISRQKSTHPHHPSPNKSPLPYHYSVSVGAHADHHAENRYLDIEPYDRTRVVFNGGGVEEAPNYLNANWVRELAGGKWWIATQAPLPNTARTFLNVILQSIPCPYSTIVDPSPVQSTSNASSRRTRVRTIVQLTRDVEGGTRKAHVYFPPQVGESLIIPGEGTMPALKVTLLKKNRVDEASCIISKVSLTPLISGGGPQASVTFDHLLYEAWPDHGVPEHQDQTSLVRFVRLVDEVNRQPFGDPDPPIMVHCSAGVGRTGAFIALSSLFRAHGLLPPTHLPTTNLPPSPLGPLPTEIATDPVALEVDSCREQRPGMVQRDEQILLIYDILTEVLSRRR